MKQETLAIHYGYEKDKQKTMAVPIYQSTAYQFDSLEHAGNLFSLKELGNIYTRLSNPTTDIFEKRFAAIEFGAGAVGVASGMASIFYTISNVAESGDNIIVAKQVYGGTKTLTSYTIKRFGIETRYFDINDPQSIEKLIDKKTKLILFETISNPTIDIPDFQIITEIANRYNILTCVDNTVATPILCNPLKLNCDLVVHSTSKYVTGQGLAIGGIIVESENIKDKIKNNSRYYHFNEPDNSYHGLIYSDLNMPIFTVRVRLSLLRDLGGVASPFNSWLHIQGLETLSLRMERHSSSALKIAIFLENHPKIKKVNYIGLKSNKSFKLTQKYLKKGSSGLLSFEVNSLEEAKNITNNTKIFSLVANIGDSKSIITHPASTTHQQLSKKELIDSNIREGLIRLSVGLENIDDLIDDLKVLI